MTAISVEMISLVIIPLFSFTINQLSRIEKAAQRYGTITAHHLDDTSSMDLEQKIIPRMDTFSYHSSSLMLLLCSPQYLAEDSKWDAMTNSSSAWGHMKSTCCPSCMKTMYHFWAAANPWTRWCMRLKHNNCEGLVEILWKLPDWIRSIFEKKQCRFCSKEWGRSMETFLSLLCMP